MDQLILGIETSCDETAAAVYSSQRGLLSNVLFSQIDVHKQYGGVIPELASRSHIEKINTIVAQALKSASTTLEAIDTVAITTKPGLPGSLLIGLSFAKGIAWAQNKKIIGVNHLEGHIFSSFLEHQVPFPHICISASGGHTAVYWVQGFGDYQIIGQTLDDAAGEAFDKIGKLLGLGYPGGPIIEKMAQEVNFEDFFNYPRSMAHSMDFSFSGLKTAVLYDLVKRGWYDLQAKTILPTMTEYDKKKVASSLLVAIATIFQQKVIKALNIYPKAKALTFVGGVACNNYIKSKLEELSKQHSIDFFSPSREFCTDNAAMIAFVGNYKAQQGKYNDFTLDIFT